MRPASSVEPSRPGPMTREAIRVDVQAFDLSSCGPRWARYRACRRPVQHRRHAPSPAYAGSGAHRGYGLTRARSILCCWSRGGPFGHVGRCAARAGPGGTLPPCRSTNSAATQCWHRVRGAGPQRHQARRARPAGPATSAACCPRSPCTRRPPTSAARERPRAAPPAPARAVPPATDDVDRRARRPPPRRSRAARSACCTRRAREPSSARATPAPTSCSSARRPATTRTSRAGRSSGRPASCSSSCSHPSGSRREQVYIANVLKSRPPNNRDPRPEEIEACQPYLWRQIELIKPQRHLHARQLRHQAAVGRPHRHHARARAAAGRSRSAGTSCTCIRSSIRRRRSTRRPCSTTLKEDFLRLPELLAHAGARSGHGEPRPQAAGPSEPELAARPAAEPDEAGHARHDRQPRRGSRAEPRGRAGRDGRARHDRRPRHASGAGGGACRPWTGGGAGLAPPTRSSSASSR